MAKRRGSCSSSRGYRSTAGWLRSLAIMHIVGAHVGQPEAGAQHVAIRWVRIFRRVFPGLGHEPFDATPEPFLDTTGEQPALRSPTAVRFKRAAEAQPGDVIQEVHRRR